MRLEHLLDNKLGGWKNTSEFLPLGRKTCRNYKVAGIVLGQCA